MTLIYIAIFACAAGLAWKIYRYDRFEKEPWLMLLLTVGLGFLLMKLVGVAEDEVLGRLHLAASAFAAKAVIVATLEDSAKLLVVLLIARFFPRQINDPLDGIIYGTFAGLGAAVAESLMYLSFAPTTFSTLGAELTRLFAHSLMGGVAGFAVGIGARPDRARIPHPLLVAGCLLVSVAVHFAWDVMAYQRAESVVHRAAPMLLMLGLIVIWGRLLASASRRSQKVFTANATSRMKNATDNNISLSVASS